MERNALKLSAAGALLMAALGIGFAVSTGSSAILLDGVFSLVGFVAALVSLRIASMVVQPDDRHFNFGYASFEPLFNLAKGILIAVIGVYALVDAVISLLQGGREIQLGTAVIYALVVSLTCFIVATVQYRTARKVNSPLVEIDAKNWLVDGLLTVAVLVAFGIGWFMQGTSFESFTRYVDPATIALLVLLTAPVPYGIVRDSLGELLLIAPSPELQGQMVAALQPKLDALAAKDYLVRMTKVGRALFVDVSVLADSDKALGSLAELDALRERLQDALDSVINNASIEINFTADPRWLGSVADNLLGKVRG